MRLAPIALLLAAAAARGAEPVDLTPAEHAGDRVVVAEEERMEGKIRYASVRGGSKADFGKRKTEFLSLKKWHYDQDTLEVSEAATVRERMFSLATKEEFEDDGKTKKKTQLPHHGMKVKVTDSADGRAYVIEGEEPEEGLHEQGWVDVLPSLLPKTPVAPGKEWDVDGAALIKAWFHGYFDAKRSSGSGKGKLQETVTLDRRKCAKLWVSFSVKGEGKGLPSLEVQLQGWVWFALEERRIVKAELAGPFTMKMRVEDTPDVGDVDVTISGTMKETFAVQIPAK